jgi:hypothetical protein
LQRNRQVLDSPRGSCPDITEAAIRLPPRGRATSEKGPFDYCHVGHGTWGIALEVAALSAPQQEGGNLCGLSGGFTLSFLPKEANGRVARSNERVWQAFPEFTEELTVLTQFDFDGDGRDELVVQTHEWGNGGGSKDDAELLRAVGTSVGDYPVGFHFTDVLDADGDGRPDLVDGDYFLHDDSECGLYTRQIRGVPLLLHSLADGTFSMSDEVARRWAVTQCPAPPAATGRLDAAAASCARLWGRSAADIGKSQGTPPPCAGSDPASIEGLVSRAPPFASLALDTPTPLPKQP